MDIVFKRVFRFNLDNYTVQPVEVAANENDFDQYLNALIVDVVGDNRSKRFLFPEHETITKSHIDRIIGGDVEAATRSVAERLMRTEQGVQERIEHLNVEVQKGILLQALVEYNHQTLFLVIKAEHSDFINESDNRRATGLPIKKKIFKAFCAYLDAEGKPLHAMVSDYKTAISNYWWNTFLELVEEHTDEYNTEQAFDALDSKIFNGLKSPYPEDYMYLRNATVQYFRSHEEFVLEDYLAEVITNYQPANENLQVPAMENNIRRLPERENFDNRFGLVRDKIRKRIIKKFKLTPQLELIVKEEIDWRNTVTAFEEDNMKFIKIRTDEGYKYFKKEE